VSCESGSISHDIGQFLFKNAGYVFSWDSCGGLVVSSCQIRPVDSIKSLIERTWFKSFPRYYRF
jgi:hypothetical protein